MNLAAPFPLGANLVPGGAQFSARSLNATRIELCLFEGNVERRLTMSKIGADHFQIFVSGLRAGQLYGFRADGPWDEAAGHRFDFSKLLLDPYALEISHHPTWHEGLATRGVDTAALMPKSILRASLPKLAPLPTRKPEFIYEVPVKAFTKLLGAVPEAKRGTVAALAHPAVISHFKRIGCDAVELMPITAWSDERHLARAGMRNAWGYNPAVFMAPEPELAPGGLIEVRDTVKALHDADLRVFMDVVFNHTGESDFGGATLSLRGLDNATHFRMNGGVLVNDTGCGNTLALDRSVNIDLVIASLRHWVLQCGIDGFRYDLAPIMGRVVTSFDPHAPLFEAIQNDDVLAQVIHIAEPWDVGVGGYQLGNFTAGWSEWNDKFRDDVRRFWRGDTGTRAGFATRLAGSSDVFNRNGRKPSASVNFVSAHDGFALADVVRFSSKHNLPNGEYNRDGNDGEICWVAADPIEDVKAILASLFFSRGTTMLTAGDEFGRNQAGNNNAYAQDNETTWRDWKNADQVLTDFVAELSKFRLQHKSYFADDFFSGEDLPNSATRDIVWFGENGAELTSKEWQVNDAGFLGLLLGSSINVERVALVFSRSGVKDVKLPPALTSMKWSTCLTKFPADKFAVFIEQAE